MGFTLCIKNTTLLLSDKKKVFGCILVIVLVNWIANFWNISHFGLYVDDYGRIPATMEVAHQGFYEQLTDTFTAPIYIRPLHNYLIKSLSLIGNALGGLSAIYLIGYIILSTNSVLFFFLLIRILPNYLFGLIGALTFCLYPVSTAKIWLTSLLGIQPALTILLVALLCYLGNKHKISYFLMIVSLFCYESIFPVFLAAPLLKRTWNRDLFYEFARHIFISITIFIVFFIFKLSFNDPRTVDLDYITVMQKAVTNLTIGPIFNLKKHLSVPIRHFLNLPQHLIFLQIFAFAGLSILFKIMGRRLTINSRRARLALDCKDALYGYKDLMIPLLSASIMLILGYAMTFYGPVQHHTGIASRIHSAAIPGGAMVVAVISISVLHFLSKMKKAFIAIGLLSLLFSSYITYNYKIQREYVDSRDLQRHFWSEVISICPDLSDSSLVLVDPSGFSQLNAIGSLNWSSTGILEKIYKFPSNWHYPPRLYFIYNPIGKNTLPVEELVSARSITELSEKGIIGFVEPNDIDRPVSLNNTIVLTSEDGLLHRKSSLNHNGEDSIFLKSNFANAANCFDKGILFNHLIEKN